MYSRWIRDALRVVALFVCVSAALASPAQATPTSIVEFPVDVGHQTNIEHLVVGTTGTAWFGDGYWPEGGAFHALIGRMDPDGQVEEFDEGLSGQSAIRDLVAAPDGNVWFADSGNFLGGSAIGKITADGTITEYSAGLGGSRPQRLGLGSDGALWFTASQPSAIGRATLDGEIGAYDLPSGLWDEAAGPDGNVWFTYGGSGGTEPAIGRIERHQDGSALITLFHDGLGPSSEPDRIVAAGGYLWFSDDSESEAAIGRISTSGQITEFRTGLSSGSSIWDLAVGSEGDVWFADNGAGAVGRITSDGQISEFGDDSLQPNWGLRHVVAGPDGNIWFAYSGGQAGVGKVSPSGKVTMFHDGYEGLGFNSSPDEIAAGPNGELWFTSWTGSGSQSIGRILPGDDNPPATPSSVGPGSPAKVFPGRLVLMGGGTLWVDRHGLVRVRLSCQSLTVACAGKLRLTLYAPKVFGRREAGSLSFSLVPGASQTMSLRLDRPGRSLLAAKHRQRAELSLTPRSEVSMAPVRLNIVSSR
jgi:streptogramin lyase